MEIKLAISLLMHTTLTYFYAKIFGDPFKNARLLKESIQMLKYLVYPDFW